MAEQSVGLVEDFQSQFQNFFSGLTTGKKIFLFSSLGGIVLGLIVFVFFTQQVTWAPLATGLKQDDASKIVAKLDELNIQYVLQPGGGGIMVPVDQVDKVRLQIASSGLQLGGLVGFELFDKNNFGATEFQQQVQYKRALEGELARLITQIDIIESAKVSVALPEKSLFIDDEVKTTASVVVDMAGSNKLNQKGVNTIVNLVSGAVPGLQAEDVRVSDSSGNLLSKGLSDQDGSESRDKNYAYLQLVEQRVEAKLLSQLEKVTGKDRVEVRVSLDMDFNISETTEDLVDPDLSAVVSEESTSEKATGSRSIPVGVPGVTSNSPEVRAGASEIANVSDVDKKVKRTNYANSKRHVISKKSPGGIKRMSVAVLLDGKYEYVRDDAGEIVGSPVYKPWSPSDIQIIESVAKQSVGFSAERGDTITVQNIRFTKPLVEQERLKQERSQATRRFIIDLVRYVLVGLIVIVLVFMVIRPMVMKLSAKPEDLDLLMGLPTTIGELEGEELEIPTEKETGIPPRDKIIEIAKQDPLKTASLVRTWLKEKKGP
ncbi:MAG: flagellar M-ring protein FliF [Candidatus Lambdaproteobacteria bacterium RIFOXYD1_FULL_56_27]|uniref:Flagellar M-ring protein n=1 Tax=Candidatus Lambdaproteobacteria bacterium RIFOXYD2_FULL_56_26 TaxID=1817773 RepID=A0A1F6H2R5_9PROT|nr:MAG: flagellar M-ring protein FliF [Candidatus Lambdaproteobacteria bacterium RIFOXYC1_FULL_56_13]OGH04655.1 MAG: flagellar M-ring protein FliF [Candidatus Lambdaproteobacteria bacterium RIFOXYD2_FULL_56_26]OGH09119.1 MAG: flagellar M-ring protein FliF [Candidatus Lambdaproteobacteria bacterium RIFOXYD1_FULL_56_27]